MPAIHTAKARESPSKQLDRIDTDLREIIRTTEIALLRVNNRGIDLAQSGCTLSLHQKRKLSVLKKYIESELDHLRNQTDFLENQTKQTSSAKLDIIK